MRWDDVQPYLFDRAQRDLDAGRAPRPRLVALHGDDRLFVAKVRPFSRGAYEDALVELLSLAAPLDADRLALSMGGRAWSLDDPVAPVVPGVGDLRQPVVVLETVDGHAGEPVVDSVVRPYDVVDGRLRWGEPVSMGRGQGWITDALSFAVSERGHLRATAAQMRVQAQRCQRLGHTVELCGAVARRLGMTAVT